MSTQATANIKLKIHLRSNWSDETTMSQIKKQGKDEAMRIIYNIIKDASENGVCITFLEEPEITAISACTDKDKQ